MLTMDQNFDSRLRSVIENAGEPTELTSLTDFEWDQFGFAPEGTRVEDLEEAFGDPIIRGDRYISSTNLFVFLQDGEIVKALMVSADWFDNRESLNLYSNKVKVGFIDTDDRPDLLHFVE